MQSIGEKLEDARKRQGITIREAAEATKIRADFLIDFENNNFSQDLPDIYKRGFIKLYASYLKLDADKLVADFNASQLGFPSTPRSGGLGEVRTDVSTPTQTPEAATYENSSPAIDKAALVKIGIVIGVVVAFFLLFLLFVSLFNSTTEPETKATKAPKTERVVERTVAPRSSADAGAGTLVLMGSGNCNVMVRDANNRDRIIFQDSISPGSEQRIEVEGPVEVVSTEVQFVKVIKGSTEYHYPERQGMGRFTVD